MGGYQQFFWYLDECRARQECRAHRRLPIVDGYRRVGAGMDARCTSLVDTAGKPAAAGPVPIAANVASAYSSGGYSRWITFVILLQQRVLPARGVGQLLRVQPHKPWGRSCANSR